MTQRRYQKPPRWRPPKLRRPWGRFWRPFRKRERGKNQRLLDVQATGVENRSMWNIAATLVSTVVSGIVSFAMCILRDLRLLPQLTQQDLEQEQAECTESGSLLRFLCCLLFEKKKGRTS